MRWDNPKADVVGDLRRAARPPYDPGDAAVCQCCGQPTVLAKKPGRGYVCDPCDVHYDDGTDPSGRTSGQDIKQVHEDLAGAVRAAFIYAARHPEVLEQKLHT